MNNELITEKNPNRLNEYVNDLTKEMDKHCKSKSTHFNTYLCDSDNNYIAIRHPGATRGYIEIDDNNIIKDIKLYDGIGTGLYDGKANDIFKKYIGMKIVWREIVV